jgi:hypothetical protein
LRRSETITLLILAANLAAAGVARAQDYPSCDLAGQRALNPPTGGQMRNTGEAHISMRVNILQADIGSARKARYLTESEANALWRRAETIRGASADITGKQGYLGAVERASYDRELDAVAAKICR